MIKQWVYTENVAKICGLFDVTADYIYYGIDGVIKEENSKIDSIMV